MRSGYGFKMMFVGFVLMMLHIRLGGFPIPVDFIGVILIIGGLNKMDGHIYFKFAKGIAVTLNILLLTGYIFANNMIVQTLLFVLCYLSISILTFLIIFAYADICIEHEMKENASWLKKMWYFSFAALVIQFFAGALTFFDVQNKFIIYVSILLGCFFIILVNRVLYKMKDALYEIEEADSKGIHSIKHFVWSMSIHLVLILILGISLKGWVDQANSNYIYNAFTFPKLITERLYMRYTDIPKDADIKMGILYNKDLSKSVQENPFSAEKLKQIKLRNAESKEKAIRDLVELSAEIISAMPKDLAMVGGLEMHDWGTEETKIKSNDYIRGILTISNHEYPWRMIIRFSNVCMTIEINGEDFELQDREARLLDGLMNQYFDGWGSKGFRTYAAKK